MTTKASLIPLILALTAGCAIQGNINPGTTGTGGGPFGGASTGFTTSGSSTTGGALDGSGPYGKPAVVSKSMIPPVSGGTLLALKKANRAVVSDPERDQIVITDLDPIAIASVIALPKGDEPGRLVEDGAGLVHVVLRGAGAIATIDPTSGRELGRQSVCANPRGIAYDGAANLVHVACVGGQLVSLAASGGAPTRQLLLDSDLRDIVVDGSRLLVSRFRSAEVLVVEADGTVSARLKPSGIARDPNIPNSTPGDFPGNAAFEPAVAWRMVPAPGGGALLSFQEEQTTEVPIGQPGGYGGFCGSIVRSAVALIRADSAGWTTTVPSAVLPVDIGAGSGGRIVVAAAGMTSAQSFGFASPVLDVVPPPAGDKLVNDPNKACGTFQDPTSGTQIDGQVVAVAFDASNRLLVQTREPMLIVGDRAIVLPGEILRDTGHDVFHGATQGGLACASCHPEGREDGHVWTFSRLGPRRTQSLGGGVLGAGPFHWSGDMTDFTMLADTVLTGRMTGPKLLPEHVRAVSGWIDRIPAWHPEPAANVESADRGRALFSSTSVGCATCHGGPSLTTHAVVDVGTGAPFKVPSLFGVGFRAPYMHDGCASSLTSRFGACGGAPDKHGSVASLNGGQLADLVTFLGTL